MAREIAIERIGKLAQAYWQSHTEDFLEHGPNWKGDHWADVLSRPELAGFVWKAEWREKITRKLILGQWKTASNDETALEAFFLTMAWGFGQGRFGRWKTLEMFKSMNEKNFGTYLLEVKGIAVKSSEDAFCSLLSKRITQLGPVYASKLLYAMSPADNRSPVMDMWVERWGYRMFGLDFKVHSSLSVEDNVASLVRFKSFCESALDVVGKSAPASRPSSESDVGFVEYLIFWDAKYMLRKRWQGVAGFPAWVQNENLA